MDWWQNWQNVIPGIIQLDTNNDVPKLEIPVTAIIGTDDWVTPVSMIKEHMNRLDAPQKKIVEIGGAGHYTFLDDPDAFQSAVVETLTNLSE